MAKPIVSIHVQGANRVLTIRSNREDVEVRVIDDDDDWDGGPEEGDPKQYSYDEAVAKHDELPFDRPFKVIYYKADIEEGDHAQV